MVDKEINLRAGLPAFSDADRVVPVNIDRFDPLNSHYDLIKMLVETGISFSRPSNVEVAAEDGHKSINITIKDGDMVGAAVRAACELAASWMDDDDVKAWKIATGRFLRWFFLLATSNVGKKATTQTPFARGGGTMRQASFLGRRTAGICGRPFRCSH